MSPGGQPSSPDEYRNPFWHQPSWLAGCLAALFNQVAMYSAGWFIKFAPTPGKSATIATSAARKAAPGPMPDRIRMAGE